MSSDHTAARPDPVPAARRLDPHFPFSGGPDQGQARLGAGRVDPSGTASDALPDLQPAERVGFDVSVRFEGPTARVSWAGELDESRLEAVSESLAPVVRPDCRNVVIDLAGLSFMDCAGLRAMLAGIASLEGAGIEVELIHPSRAVQRLFAVSYGTGPASRT